MTTTTYRNETTGYWVTLIDVKPGVARVVDSLDYDFPMIGADYAFAGLLASSRAKLNGASEVAAPAAPAQMASPLCTTAQVRSARPLATGATLTMPTEAEARSLTWANGEGGGWVGRGRVAPVTGRTAPLTVLQAMARRGWLDLNHRYRPTGGHITDAGRSALEAYEAKHGEVVWRP